MSIFGWSYPPGCSGPPDEDAADDVCAWCGTTLPDDPQPDSWQYEGYCDARCALYQTLSDIGIAAGLEPPASLSVAEARVHRERRDLILRTLTELLPREG
jgi:hypothetical protein